MRSDCDSLSHWKRSCCVLCRVKRLRAVGKEVGINFTGLANKTPYMPASHALLEYAKDEHGPAKQNEIQEALFKVKTLIKFFSR